MLSKIDASHETRRKRRYRWLLESRTNRKSGRQYFKHGAKAEAEAHKDELERQLPEASESNRDTIDEKLLTEAAEGPQSLAPFGKTISDAISFYIDHLEAKAKQDSTTLNRAIGIFPEAKINEGIENNTVKRSRGTLNRFLLAFPKRTVSSVESNAIERWWEAFGSVANERANRTAVDVFSNWMLKSSPLKNIIVTPVPSPPKMNKRAKLAKRKATLSPAEFPGSSIVATRPCSRLSLLKYSLELGQRSLSGLTRANLILRPRK